MKIDLATARRELAAVVSGRESYVYPGAGKGGYCYYFDKTGAPSCIVGHVLARLEVGPAIFQATYLNATSVVALVGEGFIDVDKDALSYLRVAQIAQDEGSTWGTALRLAEATVPPVSLVKN